MKTLKIILAFVAKQFHWIIPVLCIILWIIFPHKPVGAVISGMAVVGFPVSCYFAWKYYKPI
jgi:hypothetical protein